MYFKKEFFSGNLYNSTLEFQVLAWDRHKNMAGLNRLMGSQLPPLDYWSCNEKKMYFHGSLTIYIFVETCCG
jgi:hypothetical protein